MRSTNPLRREKQSILIKTGAFSVRRPLIGITPQYDALAQRVWIRSTYSEAVLAAGGIPVFFDLCTGEDALRAACAGLDGVLFSGGVDLHPRLYGALQEAACGEISPERDAFESALFDAVLDSGIPVLGICRGIQALNVFAGGTLMQHIEGHSDGSHRVRIVRGTRLHALLGTDVLEANSYHHQCVRTPAPGTVVSAYAADGTIEGIELPGDRFFVGVQWHPERILDNPCHRALMDAFIGAARAYGNRREGQMQE